MTFGQFKTALGKIAELLGVDVKEIKKSIALSSGPLVNNITLPCYVQLHDGPEASAKLHLLYASACIQLLQAITCMQFLQATTCAQLGSVILNCAAVAAHPECTAWRDCMHPAQIHSKPCQSICRRNYTAA
jgi:hypothetical protein